MRRIIAGLIFISGFVVSVDAKSGFFEQNESAQHLLQAQGDTFRFFRHNIICSNWKLAQFDHQDKTDREPSLHLSDTSGKAGVTLRSHHPIVCQPFTRYRIVFKCKLNSYEKGPLPNVEINLYDFNRDYIRSLVFEIPADDAGKGWLDKQFDFVIPYDGHALMASFESRGQTICDVVFDEAYVKQVSESGALLPAGRKLFSVQDDRSGEWGRAALKSDEQACFFAFNFAWQSGPVQQSLLFEWLNGGGEVIGTEICRFSSFSGVRPEWGGVQAEWFRRYHDSADKVHCRRDRFFNEKDAEGFGQLDGMLIKPDGAKEIRVRRVTEESSDSFEVKDFVLKVRSLELSAAGLILE